MFVQVTQETMQNVVKHQTMHVKRNPHRVTDLDQVVLNDIPDDAIPAGGQQRSYH